MASSKPVNTQYDTDTAAGRAAMEKKVTAEQTPPQWLDHKGRPNTQNPAYKPNPARDHRDYREFVAESQRAGKMTAPPKDMVEKVARDRAKTQLGMLPSKKK